MAKTMTKKEMFAKLLTIAEVASNAEMVDFINKQIELLDKRYSTERSKPTKTQVENDGFKTEILSYLMTADTLVNIKELQDNISSLAELSNQRIARLVNDLVKDNKIVKEYIKKSPYYRMAV